MPTRVWTQINWKKNVAKVPTTPRIGNTQPTTMVVARPLRAAVVPAMPEPSLYYRNLLCINRGWMMAPYPMTSPPCRESNPFSARHITVRTTTAISNDTMPPRSRIRHNLFPGTRCPRTTKLLMSGSFAYKGIPAGGSVELLRSMSAI